MKKRAELTSTQLVTIILLLMGFAILVFVFFSFDWNLNSKKQVCHESVVYRGIIPGIAGAKTLMPLKCETEKVCITSGLIGGKCTDEFDIASGVTKVKVSNPTQIEKAIAENFVDCWSMMGKGKLSLFQQYWAETYGLGGVYPTCVVCSRIAFDSKKLEEAGITNDDLAKIDVMGYMRTHLIPGGSITYYDYLLNGSADMSEEMFTPLIVPADSPQSLEAESKLGIDRSEIDLNGESIQEIVEDKPGSQIAIVFMQISAPSQGDVLKNVLSAAGAVAGISFYNKPGSFIGRATIPNPKGVFNEKALRMINPTTGRFISSTVKVFKIGALTKILFFGTLAAVTGSQAVTAYNRAVSAGYCGDVSTGSEARDGCSVVRIMNYNEEDLSRYCSVIESS
ncbi:MAG: hypothetical protein Q7S33_05905 [Nanoarchaeota archaeon]|nr:hypothetical protein [Nanoarchaeota archaeon]